MSNKKIAPHIVSGFFIGVVIGIPPIAAAVYSLHKSNNSSYDNITAPLNRASFTKVLSGNDIIMKPKKTNVNMIRKFNTSSKSEP